MNHYVRHVIACHKVASFEAVETRTKAPNNINNAQHYAR